MSIQKKGIKFIEDYINRVDILMSSVPHQVKAFLPQYLYKPYLIRILVSKEHGFAFHFLRPSKKRSIKAQLVSPRIEEHLFPKYIKQDLKNMYCISAERICFQNIHFTSGAFRDKNKNLLPKRKDIVLFIKNQSLGNFKVLKNGELKLIDISIYWLSKKHKPDIRYYYFTWIFGSETVFNKKRSGQIEADIDFYNQVFINFKISNPLCLNKEVYKFYITLLEEIKNHYIAEINRTDITEPNLQILLEKFKFILNPSAKKIMPEVWLGKKYRIDFVIFNDDSTYTLVEIEPSTINPFKNGNLTGRYKGAKKQIDDWQQWIKQNKEKSKKIFGNCKFKNSIIIMGILENMDEISRKLILKNIKSGGDHLIFTYDMYIAVLSRLQKQFYDYMKNIK